MLLTKTVEENDIEGVIPVVTHVPRKLLTPNRIINSLDAALELDDYDEVRLPLSVKGDNVNEILTGYLGPKSKADTKNIYWTSEENTNVGRQRSCVVIRSAVSIVRYADDIHTITDCFHKFIDEQMIELVVSCTNIRLESIIIQHLDTIKNNSRYSFLHETDSTEIRALFGLVYFRGLLGLHNHKISILFSQKAGHPVFGATMSRNRFQLLIANLMFDKSDERKEKWPYDRFTAIRDFFEGFNLNCLKHVIPSEYLLLDETLFPMRHQIGMKQYNRNKPAKYTLLFKSLNDARFPYTYQSTCWKTYKLR